MARIAGVDLPRNKRMEIALTYIYGIGLTTSRKILTNVNISFDTKTDNLTEDEVNRLRIEIENYEIEGELRRKVNLSIKRLSEINSYRGMRHRRSLPVRGQRSKTNARTRRGRKAGPVSKKSKK